MKVASVAESTLPKSCPAQRASKLPPAVKYFLMGGLCALLGTTWSGVHLWLALHGQINKITALSYHRELHLILQLYFFLGSFISGYLLQAGSKLFALTWERARLDLPVFFLQMLSLFSILHDPLLPTGRLLFSCSLVLILLQVTIWWWRSNKTSTLESFVPIALGLIVLTLGIHSELSNPIYSLALVWFGLLPIILASAQQFIHGFLGGTKLSARDTLVPYVCYLLSIPVFMQITLPNHSRLRWHDWSSLALIAFAFYCYHTKVIARAWAKRSDIIGLALLLSIFWLFVGSLSLALLENPADAVLHCWCIGVAGTLTLAASSRIMGFLARNSFPKDRLMLATLWLWQVVAIGRCKVILLPAWFSWVTGISASLALTVWLIILFARAREIYKAKPELQPNAKKQSSLKVYQGA